MLYQIIPALCLILSGAPIDVYCLVRGLGNTIVTSDHSCNRLRNTFYLQPLTILRTRDTMISFNSFIYSTMYTYCITVISLKIRLSIALKFTACQNDNQLFSMRDFHSKDLKDQCRWIPNNQQYINTWKWINSPPMTPTEK